MISYPEWKAILSGARLPAAVVDLDAFDRNAALLGRIAADSGKTLRLATKSLRVPELIRRALANPVYRGLMCYSAEEAEFLAAEGFDDLLVAYPTVQPGDLAALRGLAERGKRVALVCDHRTQLEAAASAMEGARARLPIIFELDLALRPPGAHLGARRSPVRTDADLRALIAEARARPELEVAGCLGYESQVAGLTDRNPFKRRLNPVAALVRRISMWRIAARRARARALFESEGIALELFNGGGSGSLNLAAPERALTELSAGSGLLDPHLFDYYSNIRFEPACFFALQAVRRSDPGFVTCQGGGYIASGEPGWDRVPKPWLPDGARLVAAEGCGEVQTPLRLVRDGEVAIGDPVLFRHAKAGELAERFDEYLLVSAGKIVGRAKTYRGLGRCFF